MPEYLIITSIISLSATLGFCVYKLYFIIENQKLYKKYFMVVDKFIDESEKSKKKLSKYLSTLDNSVKDSKAEMVKHINEIKKIQRRQNK